MLNFKIIATALTAGGLLVTQVQAGALSAQNLSEANFNQIDIGAIFDNDGESLQLAALSNQEMKETEGAWIWWAVGGAVGGVMNTGGYIGSNPDWTYGKAAYSFLSGAAGGIIGTLPGGSAMRVGYGALGAYTGMQPWGGYSWARW